MYMRVNRYADWCELARFDELERLVKYRRGVVVLGMALIASAAMAHQGVKNPAVMARMEAMSGVGAEMKTMGEMAKGARPFDADAARAAATRIAGYAAETPALFMAQEDDPKSEARAAIWDDFADFTAKASDMEQTATQYAGSIETLQDVQTALSALGKTCTACHKPYRE